MSAVYRPDGTLLACSVAQAAKLLGVSRQAVYNAADETRDGRRLRYVPAHINMSRRSGGRPPVARIRIGTGPILIGWRAAVEATGRRRQWLQEQAEWSEDDKCWEIS